VITPRNRASKPAATPPITSFQPIQRELVIEKTLAIKCPLCGRTGTLIVQRSVGNYKHVICAPPNGCGRPLTINVPQQTIAPRQTRPANSL
jgi:hypothetical protein